MTVLIEINMSAYPFTRPPLAAVSQAQLGFIAPLPVRRITGYPTGIELPPYKESITICANIEIPAHWFRSKDRKRYIASALRPKDLTLGLLSPVGAYRYSRTEDIQVSQLEVHCLPSLHV